MDKQRFILTPKLKEPRKEGSRKNRIVFYALIVGFFIIAAVAGVFIVKSLTDSSKNELIFLIDGEKSFFEARLGDQKITMELTRSASLVAGRYFYHDYGRWIKLKGMISRDGVIQLNENYRSKVKGNWVVKMSANGDGFLGDWNNIKGDSLLLLKGTQVGDIQPELMRRTVLHMHNQNNKEIDKVMWMWSEKPEKLYDILNLPSKDKIEAEILNSWKNQNSFRNIVKKIKWIRKNTIAVSLDYEYVLASKPNEKIIKESTVIFEFDSLRLIESEYNN